MRYRPFGTSGKAVSAISLLLRETANIGGAGAWRKGVVAAMEQGINCFELTAGGEALALGFGEALRTVERRLIFLGWRIRGDGRRPITGDMLSRSVRAGLQRTGAGYFDLLMLDETAFESLTSDAVTLMNELRAAGVVLQLGIAGEGAAVEDCIRAGAFDVLAAPFNLTSDYKTRRQIKDAAGVNMAAIGYDPFPDELCKPKAEPVVRRGLFRRPEPLAGMGTYAFLHDTPGWTAEELCLAYALTEPSFATIQLDTSRMNALPALAAVPDRDMPAGVPAQIEMARFGSQTPARQA